jgi:hypothetical protein
VQTNALGHDRFAHGSPQAFVGRTAGALRQPADASDNVTKGTRESAMRNVLMAPDGSAPSTNMPVSART